MIALITAVAGFFTGYLLCMYRAQRILEESGETLDEARRQRQEAQKLLTDTAALTQKATRFLQEEKLL